MDVMPWYAERTFTEVTISADVGEDLIGQQLLLTALSSMLDYSTPVSLHRTLPELKETRRCTMILVPNVKRTLSASDSNVPIALTLIFVRTARPPQFTH